jgi:diguanylate cyclase
MLALCLLVYLGALMFGPSGGYDVVRDGWLAEVVLAAPGVACLVRAAIGGPYRLASLCLGVGMLSFAAGNLAYVSSIQFQIEPAVPSLADVGFLGFYPFACAGVLAMVRPGAARGAAPWLDGLLGAAGAATGLAVLLNPVLSTIGGDLPQVLVTGAYPVGDLLLVSMLVGTLAVRGVRGGATIVWVAAGLLCFCVADVVYALRVAADAYQVGTPLDALWGAGMTVMTLALWRPARRPAPSASGSIAMLGVPLVSTIIAVGVLLWATRGPVPGLTAGLATLTLVLACGRTLLSFRQLQRLTDASRQARTDDLTGLGNRRALYEQGAQRLSDAPADARVALLLIDLDRFKEINDALGHHVGDELLREIGSRLAPRANPRDTLARLGGDEFALMIGLEGADDPRRIAQQIVQRIGQPLRIDGVAMRIGASIGIAEYPAHGRELTVLLRRADIAMYEAKRRHSGVETFAAELDAHSRDRLQAAQELSGALDCGQFVLHYQPKVNALTGATVSVEALVRWQHPRRGLLFPDAFLALIEQSGLTGQLTETVLDMATRQAGAWRAEGVELPIAVNLSASDLLDDTLPERVHTLLVDRDLPPHAIEVEITESQLMVDPDRAQRTLAHLREFGITIAVDDYGTGYSSLAYLRDLPIDQIKIDRSFVARIAADIRNAAIVRSTIELAHALDLEVVAEGVEDAEVLTALVGMGCEWAQGFHFSRPLPPGALTAWLRERIHTTDSRLQPVREPVGR